MSGDPIDYSLSVGEIDRRREAYTRLVTFAALGATVSSLDVLVRNPVVVAGALLALVVLLFGSRAFFMRLFDRYVHTVWALSDSALVRNDQRSRDEYDLNDVERIRAKYMVSGDIRAITISLRSGGKVDVNALPKPKEFLADLVRRCDESVAVTEIREPIDYDHPRFYRLLGLAVGLTISLVVRIAASTSASRGMWIYLGIAAYMIAFGLYWLRMLPFSQSHGGRSKRVDIVLGIGALVAGVGLGALAFVL